MAIKDFFQKSLDMVNKSVESVKNKAIDKKDAIEAFEALKNNSTHIGPMKQYEIKNTNPQLGREQKIIEACLTINVENAKVVNNLIPLEETIIDIKMVTEAKTSILYIFAITDKRLWILNKSEYMTMNFQDIRNLEIVNKGLMSQSVRFNDNAFEIEGNLEQVTNFINTLVNTEFRNNLINSKICYLCGKTPKMQILNKNMNGITLTTDNKIILHNEIENRLLNFEDIETVQLLVNDSVVLSRSRIDNNSLVSNPMEARKMSVKFILNTGNIINISILEQNTMGTSYKREDSTYIDNYEMAKKIIETVIFNMRGY